MRPECGRIFYAVFMRRMSEMTATQPQARQRHAAAILRTQKKANFCRARAPQKSAADARRLAINTPTAPRK